METARTKQQEWVQITNHRKGRCYLLLSVLLLGAGAYYVLRPVKKAPSVDEA